MKKRALILAAATIAILAGCGAGGNESLSDGRYENVYGEQWGCHDPKLFQDGDGTFYVYSTGWEGGVQVRTSTDLKSWKKQARSPFEADSAVSKQYGAMYWDDDFLKWTGFATNNGKTFSTAAYQTSFKPQTWAPTVINQNGKYYMLHGIVMDCLSYEGKAWRAGCISLSISDSPKGPFVPASQYDPQIYAQSTLVRCVWSNKKVQSPAEIGYEGSQNSCKSSWNEGFGCIDPEFVIDVATGELVTKKIGGRDCYAVTYGSWLGGIALVYVDAATLKPVCAADGVSSFDSREYHAGDVLDCPADSVSGSQGVKIAGGFGAAYEGAEVIYNSDTGFYYLFVSMGNLFHEYRVGVGRSRDIAGPYEDAGGESMSFSSPTEAASYHSRGSKILGAWQFGENSGDEYGFRSPGGQSILRSKDGEILLANHTRTNYFGTGNFALQIHRLYFTADGWVVADMNDYDREAASRPSVTEKDIAGKYLINVTSRCAYNDFFESTDGETVDFNAADEKESLSKKVVLSKNGRISGSYSGNWKWTENGEIELTLIDSEKTELGTFRGVAVRATDNARKAGKKSATIALCLINSVPESATAGEYAFANKL